MPTTKLVSLREAIAQFIPDGSTVVIGVGLESCIPFAAGHEIIRQRKRDLTLVGPISDILFDQLIGAGCVRAVRAAWVGNVITGSGYSFRRAVEGGRIEVEDHSNLTLALGLRAGAMGVRLGRPLSEPSPVDRPELGLGDEADVGFLDSTIGLVWRALVVILFLLLLLAIARALS